MIRTMQGYDSLDVSLANQLLHFQSNEGLLAELDFAVLLCNQSASLLPQALKGFCGKRGLYVLELLIFLFGPLFLHFTLGDLGLALLFYRGHLLSDFPIFEGLIYKEGYTIKRTGIWMFLRHPGDCVVEVLECEPFIQEFLSLLDRSLSLFL